LDGHEVVDLGDDVEAWAGAWAEAHSRKHVAADDLPDGTRVSTVFLGTNHNFGDGPPLWFETMVFPKGKWEALDCARYTTWAEAEAGHRAMVEKWRGSR
jgi:hypothetical protein